MTLQDTHPNSRKVYVGPLNVPVREIARLVGVGERQVYRYACRLQWGARLRRFKPTARRPTAPPLEQVRALYEAPDAAARLTVPEIAQSVVLTRLPGRASQMPGAERLQNFAGTGATLVLHLAIQAINTIVDALTPVCGEDCPVAVVARATWPDELILRGTLADIGAKIAKERIEHTAIVLIGRALAAEDFRESALYDPSYQRRFRGKMP